MDSSNKSEQPKASVLSTNELKQFCGGVASPTVVVKSKRTPVPFFARFLESQEHQTAVTLKYPSDADECSSASE